MAFVGYTDNFQTYKFYDAEQDRLVISCDVVFTAKIGLGSNSSDQTIESPAEQAVKRIGFDFGSAETSEVGESSEPDTNGGSGNNTPQSGDRVDLGTSTSTNNTDENASVQTIRAAL